jgi:hypothetical protein
LQPGGKVRWNLFYFDKFNFTMQGILFGGWDGLDVESSQNWGYLQLAGSGGSSSSSSAAPVPAPTIPPTPSNAPPSQDIQTFARLANESDLSPDRIQFLGSHFDMILNSFPFREKITQLKKVNPQLKVLLFTNPYFSWGDEFWNKSQSEIQASQQKYSLKTTDNKTILYSGPTYGGMDFEQRIPLMDVTNSKWQNYYSSQVKKYVQYGKLDGLFIDTMGEDIPPWALAPGHRFPKGYSATNWKNQNHAFLKKVKQAFSGTGAMIVFNGISRPPGSNGQIPNRGMLNQVDGTFIEAYSVYMPMDKNDQTKRWYFEQTILKDMKTISEQGKVVLVEVYGDRADEQTRLYALTSYLLIQNKKTYFSFTKMDEAGGNRWYPEWGVRLGKPRGTYQVAGGAYSRDYDNGKVLVNPSNKSVAVPLTRSYKDWKGNQIGNVLNIPAFGGALLINN